jgi:hypothetical protein
MIVGYSKFMKWSFRILTHELPMFYIKIPQSKFKKSLISIILLSTLLI